MSATCVSFYRIPTDLVLFFFLNRKITSIDIPPPMMIMSIPTPTIRLVVSGKSPFPPPSTVPFPPPSTIPFPPPSTVPFPPLSTAPFPPLSSSTVHISLLISSHNYNYAIESTQQCSQCVVFVDYTSQFISISL